MVFGCVGGGCVGHGKVLQTTFSISTSPLQVLQRSEYPPPQGLEHIVYADHSPHTEIKNTRSYCLQMAIINILRFS